MSQQDLDQGNLLPHLFIGTWAIAAQTEEPKSLKKVTIRLAPESESQFQLVYWPVDLGTPVERLLEYHAEDSTLQGATGSGAELSISFWRHPSGDMIFALEESADGVPMNAWSAQRLPEAELPRQAGGPSSACSQPWKIVLREGYHAAKEGYVTLEELKTSTGAGTSDESGSDLGLFGLFHWDSLDSEYQLYDLMIYDENVKSFNSVFGVRSVNYWQGDPTSPKGDRLFATFNNRSSIPATRLGSGASQSSHKLGQLMPFERGAVARAHSKLEDAGARASEEEDPDVGVWVGEPP